MQAIINQAIHGSIGIRTYFSNHAFLTWRKKTPGSSSIQAHEKCAAGGGKAGVLRFLAMVALAILIFMPATGESSPTEVEEKLSFNIPQQRVDLALILYAEQAGVTFVFPFDEVRTKTANALAGVHSREEAINILLNGTGLKAEFGTGRVLTIRFDQDETFEGKSKNMKAKHRKSSFLMGVSAFAMSILGITGSAHSADADDATKVAQVEEIVVIGAKRKFAPEDSNAATKINMAVIDTPQSLSVLSSELINIVSVKSINAAAALTPGVVDAHSDNHLFFDIYARGFKLNFYNGFKINGAPFVDNGGPLDLGVVDRFEVVRGPASIIYGQSDYGATVNVQLKSPKAKSAFAGELGTDINGSSRALVDVTGAVSKDERLRARLIVIYDRSKTPQDLAFSRTTTVAPSFSFDITDNTKFDFNYFHGNRDVRFTQGFALVQDSITGEFSLPDVPRNAFLGADFNLTHATTDFGVAKLSHNFGDNWTLAATGAWSKTSFARKSSLVIGPIPETGDTPLHDARTYASSNDASADLTLTGDFQALGQTHTLMLSGFYRHLTTNYFDACCESVGTINIFNPVSTGYVPFYNNFPTDPAHSPASPDYGFTEYTSSDDLALSGLLLLHPVDRLSVMLGLRYNEYKSVDTDFFDRNLSWQTPARYKNDAVTHRVGVVYEVIDGVNIYGSYSDGVIFQPAITASGSTLAPETGVQWEFGAKAALLDKKLTVSAAAFKIDRKNVATQDPAHPTEPFSVAINGQTHKGFELEAVGEPIPGWNIISSYSYLDVSVKDAPDPAMIGKQRAGTPHHMIKLYTTYQLLDGPLHGLSFGGGMFHNSAREVDDVGTLKLPAYTRFDLRLGYDALENISFSVNAINITDKKILTSAGYGKYTGIDYQSRRTVSFGVNFKY